MIESKIGAGLIEEVIQVAEGELQLVDEMLIHQPYVLRLPRNTHFQVRSRRRSPILAFLLTHV